MFDDLALVGEVFRDNDAVNLVQGIMNEGRRFSLRKWNSTISQTEQFVKILGIYSDVIQDEFRFDLPDIIEFSESSLPVTNRSMLKLSAKIFDPVGLLTPFTFNMKIPFQSLCVEKVNWDESLEGEDLAKWKSFINDLKALKIICAPRC